MHGVVSLLDERHYELVESIWREMRAELGLQGVYVTPFPHFSYQVAEHYDMEAVAEVLADSARQTPPFAVQTTGLGIFTGGLLPVVYVNVARDPHLTELHQMLWSRLAPVSTGILAYYHPQVWVPHITLGHGDITRENLPDVVRLLQAHQFAWRVPVDNVALLYDEAESRQDQLAFRFDLTG